MSLINNPKNIWTKAISIDNFILKEFVQFNWRGLSSQEQSIPTGQTQGDYTSLMQVSKNLSFNPKHQLQMNPAYIEKNPIKIKKALQLVNNPTIIKMNPCPISPNIIPKKKGKITVAKVAGFIYPILGIPQAQIILLLGCVIGPIGSGFYQIYVGDCVLEGEQYDQTGGWMVGSFKALRPFCNVQLVYLGTLFIYFQIQIQRQTYSGMVHHPCYYSSSSSLTHMLIIEYPMTLCGVTSQMHLIISSFYLHQNSFLFS